MLTADILNQSSSVISPCVIMMLLWLFNFSVITGYVWRANKSNSKFSHYISANLNGVIIDEETARPAAVYIEQVVVSHRAVNERCFLMCQLHK